MPTDQHLLPGRGRPSEGDADADASGTANLAHRPDPLAPARLEAFVEALADPDSGRLAAEIARLRREGLAGEVLLDHILPEAARALGALWVEDRLSFVAVTTGCARLQGLLHRAEPPAGPEPGGPGVVVCTMPGAQHTLGALLAASQLRRARVSVRLAMGTQGEIAAAVRGARPALVAISAPAGTAPAALRALADGVRGAMGPDAKLAVGGSLVTAPDGPEDGAARIARETGADFVGSDIVGLAARCGLTGPAPARRRAGGSP